VLTIFRRLFNKALVFQIHNTASLSTNTWNNYVDPKFIKAQNTPSYVQLLCMYMLFLLVMIGCIFNPTVKESK